MSPSPLCTFPSTGQTETETTVPQNSGKLHKPTDCGQTGSSCFHRGAQQVSAHAFGRQTDRLKNDCLQSQDTCSSVNTLITEGARAGQGPLSRGIRLDT